jgi:hypothetical protein
MAAMPRRAAILGGLAVLLFVGAYVPVVRQVMALTFRAQAMTAAYERYAAVQRFILATTSEGEDRDQAFKVALAELTGSLGIKVPAERP